MLKAFLAAILLTSFGLAQIENWTHCEYEGQKYTHGESWNPDCGTRCFCMSSAVNASICQSICPTYTYLAPHCRLEKVDGKCCPKIKCNWMDKCRYRGNWYSQDEEFDIECKYRCKCANAKRSYFQCKNKCVTWPTPLWEGCRLEPPKPGSGECCSKLRCS